MSLQPKKIRQDFPALKQQVNGSRLVYLDNAATTQKPESVIERVEEFYRQHNANPGRSLHELARRATEDYEGAREKVAGFVNAGKDEIVFTRNTSESINLVASSLELDGKILVPEMAHHSEQLPWREKAKREGLGFEFIPTSNGRIDLEALGDMVDGDTALVSLSHISNVFGAENPVGEIVEIAHENDALVLVDAAQSVPRMPVDMKELGADFLAFSGHKMLGPTGIGVLYGRKELLEEMAPYQVGGGMIKSVKKDSVEYAETPQKFEAGTPNVACAAALSEAIDYLENVGLENINRHEKELVQQMVYGLGQVDGVDVISPRDACLVSFTMEDAHPHDVSEVLNQEGVAVRAGHHCAAPLMESLGVQAAVRASPYLYNTAEDVEQFLEAVGKVKEVFG